MLNASQKSGHALFIFLHGAMMPMMRLMGVLPAEIRSPKRRMANLLKVVSPTFERFPRAGGAKKGSDMKRI